MTKTIHFYILLLILSALTGSCNDASSETSNFRPIETADAEEDNEDGYQDGTWCAEVEYYNPNTGTRNTYELDVEVENNELTQIDWPNGGWLDESHFISEDISDGECSFRSDRGYRYTVTLKKSGGCGGSDAYRMRRDIEQDEEDLTCPKCGDEKDEYDDLCDECQSQKDEAEDAAETCPVCSGSKSEWDKICDDCREKEVEKLDPEEDDF